MNYYNIKYCVINCNVLQVYSSHLENILKLVFQLIILDYYNTLTHFMKLDQLELHLKSITSYVVKENVVKMPAQTCEAIQ